MPIGGERAARVLPGWATLSAALVAGLVCTGCAARAPAPVRAPSSPALPTAATTAPSPSAGAVAAQAVIAAYNGMWADEVVAARSADYQSPLLAQHAAGAALSLLIRGLYSYRLQHLVIKGQLVTHPVVTSLSPPGDPTKATVLDCSDDSHWLVYKASGGLENNIPGGHRRVTAVLQDQGGVWKVVQLNTGVEGSC